MHNVQHFHDGGTIIGDGHRAAFTIDEFVHAARPESGAHHIDDRLTGVNVANQLRDALGRICTLTQQDDARLLSSNNAKEHHMGPKITIHCQQPNSTPISTPGSNIRYAQA